jgi:glycine dehydrogenase subunit 1
MAYLPLSDADRAEMLRATGCERTEDLFATLPDELLDPVIELPEPLSEQELVGALRQLATRNRSASGYDNFLGAGVYQRFIPALVGATISRPEFYTTYTPYQAEASQGTLQTIFEFQSMICALTGLDVANASLYDGATAAVEAVMLAVAQTRRHTVAVSAGVHPETRTVLETYCRGNDLRLDVIEMEQGLTPAEARLSEEHACLLMAQPSFFGTVETLPALAEAAHRVGALAVCSVDPIACALITPPGEAGFDVAVGDGQQLGIPPSFGGPHLGFMAVTSSLMRRIPGRLAGLTRDAQGDRAFALTLQTREQHIRRERATSNVCTNHALMALAATVYMSLMGAGGMRAIAETSVRRAHHLAERLQEVSGFELAFPQAPYLWEFTLRCPRSAEALSADLREQGILAGFPLCRVWPQLVDSLLISCTEMTSTAAIDRYVNKVGELANSRSREMAAV